MELAHANWIYRFGETEPDFRKETVIMGILKCDAGFSFETAVNTGELTQH